MSVFNREIYLKKSLGLVSEFMQQYEGVKRLATIQEFQAWITSEVHFEGDNKKGEKISSN